MFYTSVYRRFNKLYVRGFDLGLRYSKVVDYQPYIFLPDEKGDFRTLDNKKVRKLEFSSMSDARKFVDQYKDVNNFTYYGLTNYAYAYINDTFKGEIDYDPKLIKVGNFDIECAADEGFPDINKAEKEITAITLRSRGKSFVFGCGDFTTNDPTVVYTKCKDEYELLSMFISCWQVMDLDVITGWNIEFFDIPYLINRMRRLFDKDVYKKLSPWGFVDERETTFMNRPVTTFEIAGVSVLDYYHLYRKFKFGNQESYKLDYIAEVEIKEKKIKYTGSLLSLYKNDYQKFIEYNIHDVVLVEKLDEKLKFLEQVMALAYDAKVNFKDTMTTVLPWDIIIHNHLMAKKVVIPKMEDHEMPETLIGGYVKEPKIGKSKWVVSFDLNSLYPHLIMMYNISPETFVRRIEDFLSIDALIHGTANIKELVGDDLSVAANGCAYRKDIQGFLPELMQKMYDDRVKYKKLMLEAKKRFEQTKSAADEKLIARYHNMQLAKKIQLNSAYGALGNLYFRWFNFNHAEAITSSGQLAIRWIERRINIYMNNLLKTKDIDYVIASDTDSIYVTLEKLVDKTGLKDVDKIVDTIDQFCEKKIQPYIDGCYRELAKFMNAYQHKMFMKRETIADSGIWRGKKMYILNARDIEGVRYKEPELKVTGIEAVRSSTPHVCRKAIKDALKIIMNGTEEDFQNYIKEFKATFYKLPFEDIAFPRTVNGLRKYHDDKLIYGFKTPIHVKGSLIFNDMLKKHKIATIPPISEGDKIKFCYLTIPNPTHDAVIATADSLPKEFNLDKYIDREIQFNKSFLEPIKSISDVIDWQTERHLTLMDFM